MARTQDGGRDPGEGESPPNTTDDESSTNKKKYIGGFPDDYSIPGAGGSSREELGDIRFRRPPTQYAGYPTYFNGDEYIPANFPATSIWLIQQQLAKVGLLRGNFSKQVWDPTTRNAYKQLLALANAQGINAEQALTQMMNNVGEVGTEGGGGQYTTDENGNIIPVGGSQAAPLVTRTSDPTQLRQLFRKAVIEQLGEGWSQDKINAMVAAYNQIEISKQTQANAMQQGAGGTISDIPSPESFIQGQVEAQDPIGVQTHQALDFTGEFMEMANNPAWGVG